MVPEQIETTIQAQMLAPFDGPLPAGEDLRLDVTPGSLYFRLRDARARARDDERLVDNDPTLSGASSPSWDTVHRLAAEALVSKSKDIEVACWLTESLVRRDGLPGLATGADVLAGLIFGFWDCGLFPAPEAEDAEGPLVAITGLSGQDRDGSLLQPLRKLVLFEREDGSPVTVWQYERSRELAALGNPGGSQRGAAGVVPLADLEASARGHGRASLIAVGCNVTRAVAAWQALEQAVAQVVSGEAVPATGRVRAMLERLRTNVERYVPASEIAVPAEVGGAAVAAGPGPTPAPAAFTAATRDGILDEVLRIAGVFRRNEPNSPFSYTLDEAVRRARLSWPDLLRELMPEIAPRSAVLSGLGIRPPPD